MNAIVKVNFLPRTPPPDLGRRLREATFPARPQSRILRFQMLVDARRAAGCDGPSVDCVRALAVQVSRRASSRR